MEKNAETAACAFKLADLQRDKVVFVFLLVLNQTDDDVTKGVAYFLTQPFNRFRHRNSPKQKELTRLRMQVNTRSSAAKKS